MAAAFRSADIIDWSGEARLLSPPESVEITLAGPDAFFLAIFKSELLGFTGLHRIPPQRQAMNQDVFVYLIVFLAVLTLAHRIWRTTKSGGSCGTGCKCSGQSDQDDRLGKRQELISLNSPEKSQ